MHAVILFLNVIFTTNLLTMNKQWLMRNRSESLAEVTLANEILAVKWQISTVCRSCKGNARMAWQKMIVHSLISMLTWILDYTWSWLHMRTNRGWKKLQRGQSSQWLQLLVYIVHTSGLRLENTRIYESGWRLELVHTSGRRLGNTRLHESGWRLKHNYSIHKWTEARILEYMRVGGDSNYDWKFVNQTMSIPETSLDRGR